MAAIPLAAGVALFLITAGLTSAMAAASASPHWPGRWSWVWPWLPPSGLSCLALLVAGAGYAAVHLSAPRRRSPSVPLALAILTVPVMLSRLPYLNPGAADPISGMLNAVTVGQLVALLLTGVTLTVLGAKTLPARDTAAWAAG